MLFEIDFPIDVFFDAFETQRFEVGITKEAPGGAVMKIVPGRIEKRHMTHDAAPVFTVMVEFAKGPGKDIAIGLFVNWLSSKFMNSKRQYRKVRINREWTEVSPEGMLKTFKESIEKEEK
jgi:hypothetical protein